MHRDLITVMSHRKTHPNVSQNIPFSPLLAAARGFLPLMGLWLLDNNRMAASVGALSSAFRAITRPKHFWANRTHWQVSSKNKPTGCSIWRGTGNIFSNTLCSVVFCADPQSSCVLVDVRTVAPFATGGFQFGDEKLRPTPTRGVFVRKGGARVKVSECHWKIVQDVSAARPPTRNRFYYLQQRGSSYK